MSEQQIPWYRKWFNQDYLKLYAYRNLEEASKQVEFLIHAMSLHGSETILDLGCGTGRHSLELAKRGFTVTGIDLSQSLIEEGRKILKCYPELRAELLVEDIYSLKNFPLFNVIICLFTSFGYLEEDDENESFFNIVTSHLKEEGKFFLDFLHPFQVSTHLVPFEEKIVESETIQIFKSLENGQVVKTIVFSNPKRTYQEKVKLYNKEQIVKMMQRQGLNVIDVWNDYLGNPWSPVGERQLFYCKKQ